MPAGVENLALLIDFAQRSKNPSIGTARQVVNILQEHYPERLGLACAINIPFLINTFFKIVLPFVDPITRGKLKFNQDVIADGLFKPDMIMGGSWKGERDFEYDHDKYWKALIKQTDENVAKWTKRWRELGAKVGISEWDYKGGDEAAEEVDGGDDDDDEEGEEEKREETVSVVPVIPSLDLERESLAPDQASSEKKKEPEDEKKETPQVSEKKKDEEDDKKESTQVPETKKSDDDDKKDTTVQSTTTTAAGGGHESSAGGAVATSGGDGGAGGGDGGAAE